MNIIKDFYINGDIKDAAETLVMESSKKWLLNEKVIDDISLILIFFEE